MKTTKELVEASDRLRASFRRVAKRAILELGWEYGQWVEECAFAYRLALGIRKVPPDQRQVEEARWNRQLKLAKHRKRLALRRKG